MENLIPMISMGVTLVGVLAFVVSVITQVIKEIGGLSKIPTDIVVVMLSVALTLLALLAYASYADMVLAWYMIVGSLLGGFFVSFVAMFGWDKITDLWGRFKK